VLKIAMAAVALALLVAGCGGSGEPAAVGEAPSASTTASTAPTSTTSSRAETEQAVLDAYHAGWDAYTAASDPADPEFPGLAETSTGPALQQAQEQLTAYQITGRVGRYPQGSIAEHRAEVVSVRGDEATVRDCNIDDGQLVIAATDEVVNDLVATVLFEASMVVEDGRWKVRSLKVVEKWDGVAGCALE
jgi:hypothetical protein